MNASTLAAALRQLDPDVRITFEHTGGGVGTIYTGEEEAGAYDGVVVGPFDFETGTASDVLYCGRDDGGATTPIALPSDPHEAAQTVLDLHHQADRADTDRWVRNGT